MYEKKSKKIYIDFGELEQCPRERIMSCLVLIFEFQFIHFRISVKAQWHIFTNLLCQFSKTIDFFLWVMWRNEWAVCLVVSVLPCSDNQSFNSIKSEEHCHWVCHPETKLTNPMCQLFYQNLYPSKSKREKRSQYYWCCGVFILGHIFLTVHIHKR